MFGGEGGDPFGNPFGHMHRQMRQMDNMMNAMLGDAFDMLNNFGMMGPPQHHHPQHPMLTDDARRYPPMGQQHQQQRFNDGMMMSPFGGFGFGGPLFGGMMHQMHNMHNRALDDPNSMVFSESTMVSYDGTGQPKVVQHSTRKAGDVKETRKTLRDGEREEMSVGHSIGDRSHIIEKKRDRDGKLRQQQKFINLAEEEAEAFNNHFKSRARENLNGMFGAMDGRQQQAIENGKNQNGKGRSAAAAGGSGGGSSSSRYRGGSSNSTPIITVPDEDDDQQPAEGGGRRGRARRGRHDEDVVYSNSGVGPTIQEIDDDEHDTNANPKRRKGVFGKFLG